LSSINPAPAQLPYSKLDWLNGQYIQQMEPIELAKFVKPFLDAAGFEVNPEALLVVMPPMSKRMKLPADAIDFLRFLFDDAPLSLAAEQLTHKYLPRESARTGFQQARELVQTAESYDLDTLSSGLIQIGENISANGKAGPFLGTLRLAVTGQQVSPPLFESMLALGRVRTLARLDEILALYE
jgi:glutamyl-tRNA synthetase